jgi:hypothetical protein
LLQLIQKLGCFLDCRQLAEVGPDLSGSALDGGPPHEFTVDEEAVTVQLAAL